ncbi:thiosulfate:glutathione sulfurtransferase [Nematolebias whitei]|uniref:thiosulfate:glutathione sulfurtransferase n=1 Tax=Nematolebias whitei TaxID=451745 RepID=UPI0018976EF6|nr:thiosulfate:glutathione sulfurtransferase [Nematolebias whitei]
MDCSVSYSDLKELVEKSQDLVLIDVRTEGEVARGSIPRSINIPLHLIGTALQMTPEEFKAKYGRLKPATDAPELVFHCQSGRRGESAVDIAHKLGYEKARNYPGGYSEWCMKERILSHKAF